MPCPHYRIKISKRAKGQSAVAQAAYQSGECLFDERSNRTKYYSDKRDIIYTEIMLPLNAPPEYADRNTLWNAVEAVENNWNSQLARRFEIALPKELTMEQRVELIREHCYEQFVSKGMIADIAIHDPDPPGHNPHAYVMLTMRPMDDQGKWMEKAHREYILDENGERKNIDEARVQLTRIGGELRGYFSRMGSICIELDANDRLRIIHDFFRHGEESYYHFDIKEMMKKGYDFRDYVCPDSFKHHSDYFKVRSRYGMELC